MSDLEKFLQQAAERMKQRMQQQGNAPQVPPPDQQPPRVQQPVQPQSTQAKTAAKPKKSQGKRGKVGGKIDSRGPVVTSNVDRADERMSEHLHEKFDHQLGRLNDRPMRAINDTSPAANLSTAKSSTLAATQVQQREAVSNPLIEMLKDGDSIRTAFIVGEIFKRKF